MFTRRLPEFSFSVYPIKSGTLEEVDCSTALAGTRGEVFFLERLSYLLSFSGK
jgi:hypothetical protein